TMAGELQAAETILVSGDPPRDARQHMALGLARNLYLQGRTEDARAVLHQAMPGTSSGAFAAMHAFLDVAAGEFDTATTAADAALRCTGTDDFSAMLAAIVKTIAVGELGRADDLTSIAESGRSLGAASPATGLLRFALAEAHSGALQLLGSPDSAEPVVSIGDDDQPPDVYRWVAM